MNNKKWSVIKINEYPTNYIVSTDGDVYNAKTKTFLKGSHDERGYVIVSIYVGKKLYSIKKHRLVAEAFIPNPEKKPTVNHIDGNKDHNYVSNLEWATHKENIDHAISTGLRNINGVNAVSNIYTEQQVHEVCKLLEQGKQPKEISELLGINENLPRRIKYNGKWKEISSQYKIPKPTKIPWKTKYIVIKMLKENLNNDDILKRLGLLDTKQNRSYIAQIKCKYNKSKGSTTIEHSSDGVNTSELVSRIAPEVNAGSV